MNMNEEEVRKKCEAFVKSLEVPCFIVFAPVGSHPNSLLCCPYLSPSGGRPPLSLSSTSSELICNEAISCGVPYDTPVIVGSFPSCSI